MVFNKKYCFIVLFAILALIAKQANGSRVTVKQCVKEFDSTLSNNQKYKKLHGNAFETIDALHKVAKAAQVKASGANQKNAIKKSHKGFLDCIKCLAVAGHIVYKTNDEVRNISDAKACKRKLVNAYMLTKETVQVAGVAIYQSNGGATEIAGNYSQQPIKKGIEHITIAGQIVYSGLDVSAQLGSAGLAYGVIAKEQGLNASSNALEAAGLACYLTLVKSAKIIFGGINKSIRALPEDKSSLNAAASNSPEASSAISYVNIKGEAAIKKSTGPARKAVIVVKKGIIAAIKGFAAAVQKPIEALKAAAQKPDVKESESSEKLIKKAIKQAENDIGYAAANAYQSLGIAAQKIGGENDDKFGKAVVSVENTRVAVYNSLQDAMFLAEQDISENAEGETHPGLKAAVNAVLTGAFVAYAELKNAADIAFEVLLS